MPSRAKKENPERVRIIRKLLLRKGGATMKQLEEELQVHSSSVKRDMAYMRDRMECPITYDRERGVYAILNDQPGAGPYELPGLWFNSTEIYALLTMQHLLLGVQPGLLEPHIQPLKDKLITLLGESKASAADIENRIKLIHFAGRRVDSKNFELLTQAVLERKRVVLQYLHRDKTETTEREVSPLHLLHYRENWLVDTWCHLRNELRTFALDAIQHVTLTNKVAVEVEQEALADHFQGGYGIYAGKADKRAVLKFNKARAQYVSLERWHTKQTFTWLPDGSYQLEVPYSKDQELVMDVLRYGSDVEVLDPPELRQRVAQQLRAAAKMYA